MTSIGLIFGIHCFFHPLQYIIHNTNERRSPVYIDRLRYSQTLSKTNCREKFQNLKVAHTIKYGTHYYSTNNNGVKLSGKLMNMLILIVTNHYQ